MVQPFCAAPSLPCILPWLINHNPFDPIILGSPAHSRFAGRLIGCLSFQRPPSDPHRRMLGGPMAINGGRPVCLPRNNGVPVCPGSVFQKFNQRPWILSQRLPTPYSTSSHRSCVMRHTLLGRWLRRFDGDDTSTRW
jgi:hypothetical protein